MKTFSRHLPALLAPMTVGMMLCRALIPEDALASPDTTAMAVVSLLVSLWFFDGTVLRADERPSVTDTFLAGLVIGPSFGFFFVQAAYADRVGNAGLASGAHRIMALAFVVSFVLVAVRWRSRRRQSM